MRHIAIEQAENDRDHIERTKQPLLTAFRDKVREGFDMPVQRGDVPDDIYQSHRFIQDKFTAIRNQIWGSFGDSQIDIEKDIENAQPQLLFWWTQPPIVSQFRDYVQAVLDGHLLIDKLPEKIQNKFEELGRIVLGKFAEHGRYRELRNKNLKDRTPEEIKALAALNGRLDVAVSEFRNELLALAPTPKERANGYQQFMQEMREERKWAGDLELSVLARYFHVNLDVQRGEILHNMYFEYGRIPIQPLELEPDQINQLVTRGVVDPPHAGEESLALFPLDRETVVKRVSAVPKYCDMVQPFLNQDQTQDIFGVEIPEGWLQSKELISELLKRDVIGHATFVKSVYTPEPMEYTIDSYKFIVDYPKVEARTKELANANKILAAYDQHHRELPTVTLSNLSAVHWDNMLPASGAKKKVSSSEPKKESGKPGEIPNSFTLFYNDTMQKLKKNEIKPSAIEWKILAQEHEGKAKGEADDQILEKKVTYTIPFEEIKKIIPHAQEGQAISIDEIQKVIPNAIEDKEGRPTIEVTEITQIKLDEDLANKLQQQEYEEFTGQDEASLKLAKQLQGDENAIRYRRK